MFSGADLGQILTELPKQAPKGQASRWSGGMLPQDIFGFYSLKSPFLGFRDIQTGYFRVLLIAGDKRSPQS